jgi:hypothetical protein
MRLVHIDPDWFMDTKISHVMRKLLTCTSLRGTSSTYGTSREVASALVRAGAARRAPRARVALRDAACFDAFEATSGGLVFAAAGAAPTVARAATVGHLRAVRRDGTAATVGHLRVHRAGSPFRQDRRRELQVSCREHR